MFDQDSVTLSLSANSNSVVQSIEFCVDHYIITVSISDFLVRASAPLNHGLNLGDDCYIQFKSHKTIQLFPGNYQLNVE